MRSRKSVNSTCGRGFYSHQDRFQQHSSRAPWKEKMGRMFSSPPVNVIEKDDQYELHLFAAGFEKKDFKISVVDQILKISAEAKSESESNWKRREHTLKSFEREFELSDKIDHSAIDAKYENGVLKLKLAKLEGHESSRQEISIS